MRNIIKGGDFVMKIGYVHSSKTYKIAEQVKALSRHGVDKMFLDRTDSLSLEGSEFSKMLKLLKPGYEVIIYEFSCLYGDCSMVVEILKKLKNENISMKCLCEEFNDISEILDFIENGIVKYDLDNYQDYVK